MAIIDILIRQFVQWALTVIIILHRPFWPHWHPPGSIPKSRPPGSDPLDVSLSTAQEICQIVEIQAPNIERFPCNLIFPILTAATTFSHARQANRGPDDERIIKEGLEVCLHWLSILGKTWKHATESTKKLSMFNANGHIFHLRRYLTHHQTSGPSSRARLAGDR